MSVIEIGWCYGDTGRQTKALEGDVIGYKFCKANGDEIDARGGDPSLVRVWADRQTIIIPYMNLIYIQMESAS